MLQKLQNGGWPGPAPVGYLNVRSDGSRKAESRLVRDPGQAPLVVEAFETYAKGNVSLTQLHRDMVARGLKTPRGAAISRSVLADMLHHPVYVGRVRWDGNEGDGTHEPLITRDLFDRVQRMFRDRDVAAPRENKHPHYLRGLIRCGCGSKLTFTLAKGGQFQYFFCVGRSMGSDCPQGYIPVAEAEQLVQDLYKRIDLSSDDRDEIRLQMELELAEQAVGRTTTAERLKRRLIELESQREKLVQAYYASALSVDLLKREQGRIDAEVAAVEQEIGIDSTKLEEARELAEMAMKVLGSARTIYLDASPGARQRLNKVIFKRVLIERGKVVDFEYQEPFRVLVSWTSSKKVTLVDRTGQFSNRPRTETRKRRGWSTSWSSTTTNWNTYSR